MGGHSLDQGCVTLQYPTCVRTMDFLTDAIDPHGMEPDIFLDTTLDNMMSLVRRHLKLTD